MNRNTVFSKPSFVLLLIVVLYLLTRFVNLTELPVFADESIYIRWSQLIIDDWRQYAFFPLNDGKTPLFIWLMVPFQFLADNQLWAGRAVSALLGLGQVFAIGWLTKLLSGKQKTQWLSMVLVVLLPFWFFHHRMALIDGLLTLWLTLVAAGSIKVVKSVEKQISSGADKLKTWRDFMSGRGVSKLLIVSRNKDVLKWVSLTGVFIGLAFWTKLPAVLLIPALPFYVFLSHKKSLLERVAVLPFLGVSVVLGAGLFLTMKLHPAFGQLFSRGGDFLYPFSEVLLEGRWTQTIISWPNYIWYFLQYMTWPVMILLLAAPFSKKLQRSQAVLLLSAGAILGPIMLFGIVVYPRYLFPAAAFLTVSASLVWQEAFEWAQTRINMQLRAGMLLVFTLLLANSLGQAGMFMTHALVNADDIPFVAADKVQYLTEWSSGHGIVETVSLLNELDDAQTVAVATEGYFGTLPDGILMYLHRQDVSNLYVEGVGQPVREIPESFSDRARSFDQVLLVVNSHRLQLDLRSDQLLAEYCRPYQAPCLQVWDITELLKQ